MRAPERECRYAVRMRECPHQVCIISTSPPSPEDACAESSRVILGPLAAPQEHSAIAVVSHGDGPSARGRYLRMRQDWKTEEEGHAAETVRRASQALDTVAVLVFKGYCAWGEKQVCLRVCVCVCVCTRACTFVCVCACASFSLSLSLSLSVSVFVRAMRA